MFFSNLIEPNTQTEKFGIGYGTKVDVHVEPICHTSGYTTVKIGYEAELTIP